MGTPENRYWFAASMQLNCWCKLLASDWAPTIPATELLLLGGLLEVVVELEGEGDDEDGPGDG